MRYADYDNMVYTTEDVVRYKRLFEKEIADKQKELSEFIDRANDRVKWIRDCEQNGCYSVLGRIYKDGKKKCILLIIKYSDKSRRDERYSFGKILEAREKLSELQEKYSSGDWSGFEYEI